MQTRNIAVCNKFGRRLKTYPIAMPSREDGLRDVDFAREALERAKEERLVPAGELGSLTVKVQQKMTLWR